MFPGMRVSENCVLNIKNKSHAVTANVVMPESGANDRRLKYCYNFFGIDYYIVAADDPIPAGAHQVRMEFGYDGGGLAKAATSPCTTTERRSGRDSWIAASRWRSPLTRPAT